MTKQIGSTLINRVQTNKQEKKHQTKKGGTSRTTRLSMNNNSHKPQDHPEGCDDKFLYQL
jgi:hypothetical protein